MKKHPITGCRPGQLFGMWAIHPQKFNEYFAVAQGVDLLELAKANKQKADAPGDSPSDDVESGSASEANEYYELTDDGVAIIRMDGPMTKYQTSFQSLFGGCSTLMTRYAIRQAEGDRNVDAIMICIDSPGGTVAGTSDLSDAIRDCTKRVHAYVEDMACSAAYWCASQCENISCNSTAIVGSIGTMLRLEDTSGAYEKDGVKVHIVRTSTFKGVGSDGVPVTEEQLTDLQREVDELNALFVGAVKSGRGMTDEQVIAVADARCHVGENAQKIGLVDSVASFDDAMRALSAEVSRQRIERNSMDKADFLKFAAENPTVLAEVATPLVATAKSEGYEDGSKDSVSRAGALAKAFSDRPAFVVEQFVKGHDVPKAKSELADLLIAENAQLREASKKNVKTDEQAGVPNLASNAIRTGSAVAEFRGKVAEKVKSGMNKAEATAAVARENPELHKEYVQEANAK